MRVLIIIFIVILLGLASTQVLNIRPKIVEKPQSSPTNTFRVSEEATNSAEHTLQLRTIQFPSPSPSCNPGKKVALDLLLDTSGSMGAPISKLNGLKDAVNNFAINLQPNDVIGVQEFSSPGRLSGCSGAVCTVIAIDTYGNNKANFEVALNGLVPHYQTYMRDALTFARERIAEAKVSFPDREWVLIFFSDGLPVPRDEQDPIQVASEIKSVNNIRIITVGLQLDAEGQQVLTEVASPSDFHFTNSPEELNLIYASLSQSIRCK